MNTTTSNNEVDVGKGGFCLGKLLSMTVVKKVKYAIGVDANWSRRQWSLSTGGIFANLDTEVTAFQRGHRFGVSGVGRWLSQAHAAAVVLAMTKVQLKLN